ncbi:hypothetical protein HPP92_025556 [Vanilla planifolia]|uniref:Uncharacterized protein n=1 Tax=Vanilla planifolia TaxID=51239 RepID=A0A835PMJ1_VANPL|nr:hypothetical protein HPP92_025556 [Vanilla planifolia]
MLLGKFIRDYEGSDKVRKHCHCYKVCCVSLASHICTICESLQVSPSCLLIEHMFSLKRLQLEQIGIGHLHWSTANYATLQELALWGGLVAMYEKFVLLV